MIRLLTLLFAVVHLFACGGGGSNTDSPASEVGTTVSDLVGVWQTIDVEDENDILYSVIKPDGTFIDYDYMGDATDQGNNCYEKSEGTITRVDVDTFKVVSDDATIIFSLEKVEGGYDATIEEIEGFDDELLPQGVATKLVETDLLESDFEICEDLNPA